MVRFAPETNLAAENIVAEVHLVGDVQYDLALQYLDLAKDKSHVLNRLSLRPGAYLLVTVHRSGNTDDPNKLKSIVTALNRLTEQVVFPMHPRMRQAIESINEVFDSHIYVIDPVGYLDMMMLEMNARMILTDSGGVQKEAYFHGVPCVTLREETEWAETVEASWNVLAGTNADQIVELAMTFRPTKTRSGLFGDGRASEKIVEIMLAKTD